MASNQPFSEHKSQFDVDLATLSNYSEIRTTHTELEWAIDWDRQIISGHAKVQLQAVKDVNNIILDASELDVKSVVMNGEKVKWKLGEKIGVMGAALHVDLGQTLKVGKVNCAIKPAVHLYPCCQCLQYRRWSCSSSMQQRKNAVLWDGSHLCKSRRARTSVAIVAFKLT
jgi:hypothetical protein